MKKVILLLTVSLFILPLYMGCKHDIKDLEKDFNMYFTKTDVQQSDAEPDDEDFDEKLMLDEIYTVKVSGFTGMFQVSAPKSNTYNWTLYDPVEKKNVSALIPSSSLTERYLIIEYSKSNLQIGKTYLITLVVTDKEGKRYSDSAMLLFCKWFDENTVDNLVNEITSEEEKNKNASTDDSEEDETSSDNSGEADSTSTDSSEEFTDESSETESSEEN